MYKIMYRTLIRLQRWAGWSGQLMFTDLETVAFPCHKPQMKIDYFKLAKPKSITADASPGKTVSRLIFFLFLYKNIRCGYSSELPRRGNSDEYPQHMFWWKNKKNINTFWPKKQLNWSYNCRCLFLCQFSLILAHNELLKENCLNI